MSATGKPAAMSPAARAAVCPRRHNRPMVARQPMRGPTACVEKRRYSLLIPVNAVQFAPWTQQCQIV